jgi:hypothetical protein
LSDPVNQSPNTGLGLGIFVLAIATFLNHGRSASRRTFYRDRDYDWSDRERERELHDYWRTPYYWGV